MRHSFAGMLALLILAEISLAADPALPGWNGLWSRDGSPGSAALDNAAPGGQPPVIRIEYKGRQDWALNRTDRMAVELGDIVELKLRAKVQGGGEVTLCATTYDKAGKAVEWTAGEQEARVAADWQPLRSRLIIPEGVTQILPRVTGTGHVTAWIDGFSAAKVGTLAALQKTSPADLTITNKALRVTLSPADATLAVQDKRTGRTWRQKATRADTVLLNAKTAAGRLEAAWLHAPTGLEGTLVVALDGDLPEAVVTLSADGDMKRAMAYPHAFTAEPPAYLVVPMNEGISYPVDDPSIGPMSLVAYGGHGICMAFYGVTDGRAGQMTILETPDDTSIHIGRIDGRLAITPEWQGQKGRFGYARRLRYVFFDSGGHVAMAKRYREYARKTGLLKTLAEKRQANPHVDLLIGAVNVWCWEKDGPAIVREMQAAGIERILWSHQQSPDALKAMNAMPGVLTSRYDIYQDAMDPEKRPLLRGWSDVWTGEAWAAGHLMLGPTGDWIRGWKVTARDGSMIPCGVLCDRLAPAYAEKRIPEDLKDHPYRSRFIDTTTASPWRECYSPDHPLTRSESRRFKMDLLAVVSRKFNLVCGCETGHDAAVPYVHYFEGMLSLGPYRVPDSGRRMQEIWDEVPENVAKFQLGHAYRLPLWELVYHDCVVAQWYWGDYNNKLPSLWDKRDLFNALYGTPPMFMFNRSLWAKQKDRFVASYKATCPVARATGYSEMTDHRFLTPDRGVQQTVFANGVTVTANFSDAAFKLPDGTVVAPHASHVVGMKP